MRDRPPVLVLLGSALFSLVVQQLGVLASTAIWPLTRVQLGGLRSWCDSAPVLAACTGLLVGAWHAGQLRSWITREWLVALAGLPFLLAVGALAAGFAQIAADLPYLPSRWLVPNLLGLSYKMLSPCTHLVLSVLGPLWLLCRWGRGPRRGVLAVAVGVLATWLMVLNGQRAALFKAAKDLVVAGTPELGAALLLPGLPSVIAGLGLVVLVSWSLPRDIPRVGRWLWLCSGLLVLDPVPVVLGWFLPSTTLAVPGRLAVLGGYEVHHGGALIDLTGGDVRLDGLIVDAEALSAGLRSLGYAYLGPRPAPISRLSAQTWGGRLRSAVRLALPASATVGDVSGVLRQIGRHGIGEVHWVYGAAGSVPGALARAFRQPAFTVLLDVPLDADERVTVPWAWLDSGGASLFDPRGSCHGRFDGVDWRDALDAALGPCRDGVVLLPSEEVTVAELALTLDRLGGTQRATMGRFRVGVVPPGPAHELFLREEARP